MHLITEAIRNPLTGVILIISFIFTVALNAWIIGFQTFSHDGLHLSARDIGLMFATFGFISIVMQAWGIRVLMNRIKHKKTILVASLAASVAIMAPLYFTYTFPVFFVLVLIYGIVSSPITPIITGLLSERTSAEDQGGILGINQSITSFGQIVGPILAGAIAGTSIQLVFLVATLITLVSLISTRWLYTPVEEKVDL